MGTDFSIKPVTAAATAAALSPPASEAPKDAVATELPPGRSVVAANAVARPRSDPQPGPGGTANQTVIDRSANVVVYQVVDNRTKLVLRQFPDEAMLRRRAYFRAMDLLKDDQLRDRATDLTA